MLKDIKMVYEMNKEVKADKIINKLPINDLIISP